jgi:hypothetical protein
VIADSGATTVPSSSPIVAGSRWSGRARTVAEPLLIFLSTRLALFGLVALGQVLFPAGPAAGSSDGLLTGATHWDAGWYVAIAQQGYWVDPQTHYGSVAFFPLYPLVLALVDRLLGDPWLAGLVVSNLCFVLALILLHQLVSARSGVAVARRSLLLLCVFPFALFYSAVYTESLFLLLTTLAFWLAERRRWWLAGGVGLLAALTRSLGAALSPALLLLYLRDRRCRWRDLRWDGLAVALPPLGTAIFMGYLGLRFGDPFAWSNATLLGWEHLNVFVSGAGRLDPRSFYPGDYDLVLLINLALTIVWLVAIIPTYRLLGAAYAIFALICVLVPLRAGEESLGRYLAVVFPVFIVFGYYLRSPLVARLLIVGSAAVLAVLAMLYANGYWIV